MLSIPITDINVFMALGDSITAGFGIVGNLEENRGLSFSIGGDEYALTLPNLFKKYTNSNKIIQGFSTGNHSFESVGSVRYEQDNLNAAQSGAVVQDLFSQIDYLGNKTQTIYTEWSHLTLFIGANNLCRICEKNLDDTPENYGKILGDVIDRIYSSFKNIIVSMLSIPNFTNLKELEKNSVNCELLHIFVTECKCIFTGSDEDVQQVSEATKNYNSIIKDVYFSKKPAYPTLLLHPFNEETIVPSEEYVSTLDCFHPSLISHENFAIATWNSLFLPFSKKLTKWDFNTGIYVPSSPKEEIVLS